MNALLTEASPFWFWRCSCRHTSAGFNVLFWGECGVWDCFISRLSEPFLCRPSVRCVYRFPERVLLTHFITFLFGEKNENSESASYCLHNLPTIIIVRRHYCLMAAINLFLIHTSACFALIFFCWSWNGRDLKYCVCVCVCTPLLLFSIIWAAVSSGGFG